MKNAEEVADKLTKTIKGLLNFTVISRQDSENVGAVVQEIAKALTDFSEESVNLYKATHPGIARSLVDRSIGRAEALEEAAKVADCDCGEKICELRSCAKAIRAIAAFDASEHDRRD